MAEQERVGVVDPALAIGQIGVTDAAGLDGDDDLAGAGVGDHDVDQYDRGTLCPRDHATHYLTHAWGL